MTIQQLFRNANPEIIFNAYVLEPVFSEMCELSLEEQARALGKLKVHIKNAVNRFRDCKIDCSDSYTLFITSHREFDYESRCNSVGVFCVNDREATAAVKKKFSMLDDSGDVRLEQYGIDFVEIEDLAGYTLAVGMDVKFGIEVCCAAILREYFFWGYDEQSREECLAQLRSELGKSEKEIETVEYYEADEVFAELDKKYSRFLSKDDREQQRLYKAYKASVRDIEDRRKSAAMEKLQNECVNAVKNEFLARGCPQ